MIHMKKMAAAVALAAACIGGAQAATTLAAGDILFTGWTAGSGFYGYSFAAFTNIEAGTEIYITDMSWKGISNNGWSSTVNVEGLYKWTVGADITAGQTLYAAPYTALTPLNHIASGVYSTLPSIDSTSTCTTSGCKASGGVVNGTLAIQNNTTPTTVGTFFHNGTTSFTTINTSDSFYIYQGGTQAGLTSAGLAYTAPNITTLIAAANNDSSLVVNGDNINGTSSYVADTQYGALGIPGVNVVDLEGGRRWAYYTGPFEFNDTASAKAAVLDANNWVYEDTISPGDFAGQTDQPAAFAHAFVVPEASTYAMLLAGLGMIGLMARRRTNA